MRRTSILIALIWLTIGTWAQQLTEQQAMDRALQYLNGKAAKARSKGKTDGVKMTVAKVDAEKIYAFNRENGGYVIASADSRTLPVLGYSDSGSIDWENMPENMRAWLKSYDEAIATLGDRIDFKDGIALRKHVETRAAKAAIEPLIKTAWYQTAPYWNKSPLYEGAGETLQGKRCYTGCAATAMAQVMNYYKWPKASPEIHAYDSGSYYHGEEKWWHIDGLPSVTFDWDNMLDNYEEFDGEWETIGILGNEIQQEAVATLMRYCGQAIYTNYSPLGSDSNTTLIVEALVNYFGYDDGARVVNRIQCSIDEWDDMIYGELEEGRPVFYGGGSSNGTPLFLCDGYDGNGLFHINWGWGGQDDGYFALSVLDPSIHMERKNCTGYNSWQSAIINVRPAPEGYQYQHILPAAYLDDFDQMGVFATDSVYFQYIYYASYSDKEILADYAFGTCADDGTLTPLFKGDPADSLVLNTMITGLTNINKVRIDSTAFQPGDMLTLYPMVKFRSIPGAEWQMLGSKDYCVYAGRTDNGQFFLYSAVGQYNIEVLKTEFRKGGGEPGVNSELVLTVRNNGEIDVIQPVYICPIYYGNVKPDQITEDTPSIEGDWIESFAYLRPGEEAEVPFRIKTKKAGTIKLIVYVGDDTLVGELFLDITTSGIKDQLIDAQENRYFDLRGRRLNGTPSRKGIYINNGNKMIIR